MPNYDYRCTTQIASDYELNQSQQADLDDEGHTFSVTQSIKDDALETCIYEDCENPVKKIFSAPGVVLKGDGWGSEKRHAY